MSTTSAKNLPWYFNPSTVIIAGCLVAIVNFGVRSSFGLFTAPVSEAHAWPREYFSFAMALQNLLWGLATPVAGAFADRFGAARVLMAGAILYSAGTAVMAYADQPMLFHMGGGVLVGLGVAFSSFGIVMAALGRIVPPERRSWAFGIATASGSLGQFIFAPLGGALISAYGWHTALLVLAASTLSIIVFAMPLMSQNTAGTRAAGEADIGMVEAITRAFGHGSYVLLVLGFFVCGFQLAFITVHLPPYLAEHGISKEFAGFAMGAIGLFNVVGSYVSGIIGGRGGKRIPLSLIYILRSIAVTLFILLPITNVSTFLFTAAMGLLWLSTVPLTMGLVTVMFGTRYMATLYGFVFVSHQIGSFLGVWLGGRLYDELGSYDPVWWMGVALGIFAAIVNLPIREKPAPAFAASPA
jgi:MFS family permease